MAVAPACATNTRLRATAALIRDRICLMGWEPSKLLLTGVAIVKNVKKFSLLGLTTRHSLTLSRPANFQALLVNSKMKRMGAFSRSSGVSLKGQEISYRRADSFRGSPVAKHCAA